MYESETLSGMLIRFAIKRESTRVVTKKVYEMTKSVDLAKYETQLKDVELQDIETQAELKLYNSSIKLWTIEWVT